MNESNTAIVSHARCGAQMISQAGETSSMIKMSGIEGRTVSQSRFLVEARRAGAYE